MVVTYKCPNCGAAMEFDGESGKLACASCGTRLTVEEYKDTQQATSSAGAMSEEDPEQAQEGSAEEFDFDGMDLGEDTYTQAEHGEEPTIQVQIFKCPSCGAELMTDEHTVATVCAYCGNPGILDRRGIFHVVHI